jgi:transposase InsO family protein
VFKYPRSTIRYKSKISFEEKKLTERIIYLASEYGRYGYRMITGLLRNEGWIVNHKRVERIWRKEGLKVPSRQPKRRRLWLNDGSCVRLRPEKKDHVWSYDFVHIRLSNGIPVRILVIIDEYTRECLDLYAARHITSGCVINRLYKLFINRGIPDHIRSDNGPEFTSKKIMEWLEITRVKTLFIEPGSPWENGYVESFNGKMRNEFLNIEIFDTMKEVKVLLEDWRIHYNSIRPHSSLNYKPPAPEAYIKNDVGLTLNVVQ